MENSELAPADVAAAPLLPVPETTPPRQSNRSALVIVFLVVFIDLLGFGIVLPLLPRYGDTYLAELIPGGKEAPLGGLILGLLMSSFSFMQFLFAPLWGRLSDRVGRRPILLLGLGGSVVFYTLFGIASDLPAGGYAELAITLLFVARLGAGVAGATIATAQAVVADCTPPERRKHGMAMIGAAFGIGFTFGPLIGFGSLAAFPGHHGVIGYTAAGLSLIALLLALGKLPETRQPGGAPTARKWLDRRALLTVLRSPSLGPVILTFFLATLGFGMFEATLALLIRDALGLAEDASFLVFAYVGFILLLAQGLLYRRLAGRLSEPTFMFFGIVLMGLGVAGLGGVTLLANQPGTDWWKEPLFSVKIPVNFRLVSFTVLLDPSPLLLVMLASLAVAVVGFALLTPSAQALVSRRTDAAKQGEILGVNQSASALARILGPFIGLVLYKMQSSHMLPYFIGAALVLLMLPLIPRIRRG
jgi:MFS family permease